MAPYTWLLRPALFVKCHLLTRTLYTVDLRWKVAQFMKGPNTCSGYAEKAIRFFSRVKLYASVVCPED